MAKYVHTLPHGRLSREYKSLVAVRKAALNSIHAEYAYGQYVTIKEVGETRNYDIGNLMCSIHGTAYYQSNPKGKPRPNNIKPGTWYLNKDGTLGEKIARN